MAWLLLPFLAAGVLAGCGDGSAVDLDGDVRLRLFTDIAQVPGGPTSYTQIATVIVSSSVSESAVDRITRVRLIDKFEQEWILSEDPEFVAGGLGWELVRERSASGGLRTGPWDLRMVVEENGVFELGHVQGEIVDAPQISQAEVTPDGVVSLRWHVPSVSHDWTLEMVRRTPDGDTVLDQLAGQGRGGGTISAGFEIDPAIFDEQNSRLVYRLVFENQVSRRVVSDALVPPS